MKTFAYTALVSILLLSCNVNDEGDDLGAAPVTPKCKIAAKQGYDEMPEVYKSFDGYKEPSPSCKNGGKKFWSVYDTNTVNAPDVDKRIYEECTIEAPITCKDEIVKYADQWRDDHKKRENLPISCIVVEGANWWGAWLTDEEVAELEETYGVHILGVPEYSNDVVGGNGNTDIPPPADINEKKCGG
jgi:hypothetical protein